MPRECAAVVTNASTAKRLIHTHTYTLKGVRQTCSARLSRQHHNQEKQLKAQTHVNRYARGFTPSHELPSVEAHGIYIISALDALILAGTSTFLPLSIYERHWHAPSHVHSSTVAFLIDPIKNSEQKWTNHQNCIPVVVAQNQLRLQVLAQVVSRQMSRQMSMKAIA